MGKTELSEKRRILAAQCRAVVHLALNIAKVHADLIDLYQNPKNDEGFVDHAGRGLNGRMNTLGAVLNGMDAVSPEDAWMDPIFEMARKAFSPEPGDAA